MLKVLTLACALFGFLVAVSIESWLRRHIGNKDVASDVYSSTLEKYSEFWLALLLPLAVVVALAAAGMLLGIKTGLNSVFAYLGAAFACFIAVLIGSRSYSSSTVSSASLAADGDLKSSFKASFRGGSVMGLIVAVAAVAALSLLVFVFKQAQLESAAPAFGLGAALTALGIRLTGSVLTAAHKLADTDEHNVDYTGAFASNAAAFFETVILSGCAAILLAEAGVDDSGIMGTFTIATAAKVPIIIMACGIVASVAGIIVFRPSTGKHSHFGFTAGSLLAGIIVSGVAFYFCINNLGMRAYAYCVVLGVAAQIISGEFCKYYAVGGEPFRKNLPETKLEDVDIPMLNGLSVGLISSFVPGILTIIAVVFSYNIAGYYGVVLAAAGTTAITAVNLAVRDYATTVSAAASFAEAADDNASENKGYYNIMRRTSAKAKAAGRAYSAVSVAITLAAVLMAITVKSGRTTVNFADPAILGGLIFGTIIILLIFGIMIRSTLLTTTSMLDTATEDPSEYRNIGSIRGLAVIEVLAVLTPAAVGFLMGINFLIAFIAACVVTGMALVFAFNNTGRYYDKSVSDALDTVIMLMTVTALVCVPAFIQFGGFFF